MRPEASLCDGSAPLTERAAPARLPQIPVPFGACAHLLAVSSCAIADGSSFYDIHSNVFYAADGFKMDCAPNAARPTTRSHDHKQPPSRPSALACAAFTAPEQANLNPTTPPCVPSRPFPFPADGGHDSAVTSNLVLTVPYDSQNCFNMVRRT